MQADVLDKAMRPALQLLAEELHVVGLDRVADSVGYEADPVPGSVHGPGEVHVLGHGSGGPAAGGAQFGGAIDREAPGRDQWLAVGVLDPLEEAERKHVLDVATPLPDAAHTARQ